MQPLSHKGWIVLLSFSTSFPSTPITYSLTSQDISFIVCLKMFPNSSCSRAEYSLIAIFLALLLLRPHLHGESWIFLFFPTEVWEWEVSSIISTMFCSSSLLLPMGSQFLEPRSGSFSTDIICTLFLQILPGWEMVSQYLHLLLPSSPLHFEIRCQSSR